LRWFTAPVEALFSVDGATVIAIILFILLVDSMFAVMDKSGILKVVISQLVHAFGGRKYTLLLKAGAFFSCLLLGGQFSYEGTLLLNWLIT
jgi:uncharacterized ion transporter superfamily protein YfcC